jgi:hypothetical protein
MITLNQGIVLDGQNLTVTTVEIYPTHIRVNFTADENNTAWLQSLNFYFVNEKGTRFDPIANGITASGSVDSPMMASHRLESSFYYQSGSLTMFITEVVWLDKDMERVKVDLANCVADKLPEGVALERVERKGDSWELTFSAIERKEDSAYQLFRFTYYDENGNGDYFTNNWSSWTYMDTPGVFAEKFTLDGYSYDKVYLMPSFSRLVELATPIEVQVK